MLCGGILGITTVLSIGCGGGKSSTGDAPAPDVRAVVTAARSASNVPALAGAYISLNGIQSESVGVRRSGTTDAVTPSDLYQVGSTAKSMTGTLAGALVEAGKIRWDTTIAEAFPDFADVIDPSYAGVTLEQLLQHRSGIVALEGLEEILALPEFGGTNREQRRAFAQWALSQPHTSPTKTFAYSNGGYAVAGAMLEVAANDSWENLIEARVLGRVGARPTFGSPRLNDLDQPWGHLEEGDTFAPYDQRTGYSIPPYLYPAGGINLSATDLARYVQAHLQGLRGSSGNVFSPSYALRRRPSRLCGWLDRIHAERRTDRAA